MKFLNVTVLLVCVFAVESRAFAQGANVDVTVMPQAAAGQSPPSRAGFLVCVGTSTDVDQYGTETTPAGGVANQNFKNLPVGATVRVTVTKAGYTGVQLNTTLRADWNNHLQASMYPGSGGPTCGTTTTTTSVPVQYDGRTISTVPLSTATTPPTLIPARLTEQPLAYHGREMLHPSSNKTLDCKTFGTGFVITGITGKAGQAIDQLKLRCTKVNSAGAVPTVNATVRYTDPVGGTDGTDFTRVCDPGKAVVGVRGVTGGFEGQLRSLGIQCRALSNGLATGGTDIVSLVGGQGTTTFAQDNCGSNRPARAMRLGKDIFLMEVPVNIYVAASPSIVAGVQLICEQPTQ